VCGAVEASAVRDADNILAKSGAGRTGARGSSRPVLAARALEESAGSGVRSPVDSTGVRKPDRTGASRTGTGGKSWQVLPARGAGRTGTRGSSGALPAASAVGEGVALAAQA